MKSTSLPLILFPPELDPQSVRKLLELLQILTRTVESYYAEQLAESADAERQRPLWEDDREMPF